MCTVVRMKVADNMKFSKQKVWPVFSPFSQKSHHRRQKSATSVTVLGPDLLPTLSQSCVRTANLNLQQADLTARMFVTAGLNPHNKPQSDV